uniref:Transmembrane 4 L6 family member 1-like n=1 Tax=Cyprinus carpio carpio TaxID=630221 RepID=A0A9J8AZN0_CYPCA
MCTGKCAKCTADLLFPLGLLAVVGNILLFFPNGEVWRTEEITEKIWFFPGVIGAGLLAFLPASIMRAAGLEGSCCANRCGMMLSMLMSVLGVAGALYCMIISAVGLQDGPLCDTGDGIFIYPFLNSTTEESYLSNQTSWAVCVRPKNVVMWNVVLFSILLSIGTLEAVLLLAQIVNGLIGCLCGTCMNENLVCLLSMFTIKFILSDKTANYCFQKCVIPASQKMCYCFRFSRHRWNENPRTNSGVWDLCRNIYEHNDIHTELQKHTCAKHTEVS